MIEAVVDPGHRRHGHGRELVREAFAQARLLGVEANIWRTATCPVRRRSRRVSDRRAIVNCCNCAGRPETAPTCLEQDLMRPLNCAHTPDLYDDAEILRSTTRL